MTMPHALLALFWASAYSAVPLTIAAVAGVVSERAGVVNIALEGLIVAGAFAGVMFGASSAMVGLASAIAVGAALGLLHAALTQIGRVDHVVSGLGINLLAAGLTRYVALRVFPEGRQIAGVSGTPFLIVAIALPFAAAWMLRNTRFGLRLRASGENPESARMAGVNPVMLRFAAVTLSGALGGLAGSYLSMADAHTFSSDMSAGKGYVALAAVIFGKWNPLGAAGAALFFGFFYALQTQFQLSGAHVRWLGITWTSPYMLDSLPYLMTLFALISVVGRARPPAALGRE